MASSASGDRDGGTAFFAHVFPVRGSHWTRGAIGEFGAPRSGGRTHEGFDLVAACRTPLVAAATGRVLRSGYDPVLYGNYLLIHGQGEHWSYFYAHLARPAGVHRGDPVWAGERVGAVGETGDARTVGCHLHFEIHVRGRPVDPAPQLRRWDRERRSRARGPHRLPQPTASGRRRLPRGNRQPYRRWLQSPRDGHDQHP